GCGSGGTNLMWVTSLTRIEARGYVEPGGAIVAERIDGNPSGGSRDIIQAVVTAENGGLSSLVLLGVTADLASGAVQFNDVNDAQMSRQAFFAAVTPASGTTAGTVVKIKFFIGTLTVDEAELEN
ncbi:MAG: hypothetical protein ACKVQU_25315, partial [Burkholderiales bacterium]